MTPWEQFTREAIGRSLTVVRRDYDWDFQIGHRLGITVATFWRIRSHEQIRLTDQDDGHRYGLDSPVDAEGWAKQILEGATIESIEADAAIGDLTLRLSGGLLLEVITNSIGYESWQAYNDGELAAVGRNGG